MMTEKARLDLVDTRTYGKMLLIDGELQSTERDEYIYHEMLVHPLAAILGERLKRVKIYGGGEGAVAREVLRWPGVEKVVQVDWDAQLLNHFRCIWTQWSQGAFSDSRLELRVVDAWSDCLDDTEKYDYIIVDLPDPDDMGMFEALLVGIKRQLALGGAFVMNAGPVQPWNGGFAEKFVSVLEELYPVAKWKQAAWHVNVPSFSAAGEWCFLGAWDCTLEHKWVAPPEEGFRRFSERGWKYSRFWPDDWPEAFARFN
jgi:spermidine synthase